MAAVEVGQFAFDPCQMTVANFSRLGPDQFAVVTDWISEQRSREQQRLVAHEERLAEFRAQMESTIPARHDSQIAWSKKHL